MSSINKLPFRFSNQNSFKITKTTKTSSKSNKIDNKIQIDNESFYNDEYDKYNKYESHSYNISSSYKKILNTLYKLFSYFNDTIVLAFYTDKYSRDKILSFQEEIKFAIKYIILRNSLIKDKQEFYTNKSNGKDNIIYKPNTNEESNSNSFNSKGKINYTNCYSECKKTPSLRGKNKNKNRNNIKNVNMFLEDISMENNDMKNPKNRIIRFIAKTNTHINNEVTNNIINGYGNTRIINNKSSTKSLIEIDLSKDDYYNEANLKDKIKDNIMSKKAIVSIEEEQRDLSNSSINKDKISLTQNIKLNESSSNDLIKDNSKENNTNFSFEAVQVDIIANSSDISMDAKSNQHEGINLIDINSFDTNDINTLNKNYHMNCCFKSENSKEFNEINTSTKNSSLLTNTFVCVSKTNSNADSKLYDRKFSSKFYTSKSYSNKYLNLNYASDVDDDIKNNKYFSNYSQNSKNSTNFNLVYLNNNLLDNKSSSSSLSFNLNKINHEYTCTTSSYRERKKKNNIKKASKTNNAFNSKNISILDDYYLINYNTKYEKLKKEITKIDFNIIDFIKTYPKEEDTVYLTLHSSLNVFGLLSEVNLGKLTSFSQHVYNNYNRQNYINNNNNKTSESRNSKFNPEIPFHNVFHGIDVMQSIVTYHNESKSTEFFYFTKIDILSSLLAGLLHDYGHSGFNNEFLIKIISKDAIIYNDTDIIENTHSRFANELFINKNINFLDKLKPSEYRIFRKRLIEGILSTSDSKNNHDKVLEKIQTKIIDNKIRLGTNVDKLIKEEMSNSNHKSKKYYNNKRSNSMFQDQQDLINFFIHISDFSYCFQNFSYSSFWTYQLFQELWNQGDYEKKFEFKISLMCDRTIANIPKYQVTYYKEIITPSFNMLIDLIPTLCYLRNNIKKNLERWEELEIKESIDVESDDSDSNNDSNNNNDSDSNNSFPRDHIALRKTMMTFFNNPPKNMFPYYYEELFDWRDNNNRKNNFNFDKRDKGDYSST